MMRLATLIVLILQFVSAMEASAQPRRTLLDEGAGGRLIAAPQGQGEALRLRREGRTIWQARDQRFELFREGAPVPIGANETAIGITGWSGGAYCCWTLHLLRRGPGGLAHIASLPLGKREPDIIRLAPPGSSGIRLADAAFDFWDVPASRAADLHPTIPFRWTGRTVEPDLAAMRRPVAEALGTACADMAAPDGLRPPELRITLYPDVDSAIATLRARGWDRPTDGGPHAGVEAARLAACLIYSGHATQARRLLREAWPAGVPGLAETERQLTARLACSPFAAAVRAVNAPRAPFTTGRCNHDSPDQTAVFALDWR